MTSALVVAKQGKQILGVIASIKKRLDPNTRLADQTLETILEELARIHRVLKDAIADVTASGCTHEEAQVIAHQAIEAMKRTGERSKRRRLANVLINGLRVPQWDKATHRLMMRLTDELEEEHIARMRLEVGTFKDRLRDAETLRLPDWNDGPGRQRAFERGFVRDALERELVARGLFDESQEPRSRRNAEKETVRRISKLGALFLDYLRDPEARGGPDD